MSDEEISRRENEDLIEAIYEFVDDELEAGTFPGDVEKLLIAKGLDADSARNAVEHVLDAQLKTLLETRPSSHSLKPSGRPLSGMANMGIGAIICAVGIVITFFSYVAASEAGGGKYVFAWGAILFGFIQFVRGIRQMDDGF